MASKKSSMLDLPYLTEACVVAVPDQLSRQLCGVVVRVNQQHSAKAKQVDLLRIRTDWQEKSKPLQMLPILLRVLRDNEDLPRTRTAKPNPPPHLPLDVETFDIPKTSNKNIEP